MELKIGEVIVLEDEKEFVVIDKIKTNNKIYLMLSNVDDSNDIAVRIEDVEQDMIFGLDSEEELSQVLLEYAKKMGIN